MEIAPDAVRYILLILTAYLAGSLSGSIMLGRHLYGIDVRNYGSKNPGANNTQRILGWKMGLVVLVFDLLKGMGAVSLVYLLPLEPETNAFVGTQIVFGLAAILGHIFPVFYNFKGGKGVATLCGTLLAIHPFAVLICTCIFLILFPFFGQFAVRVVVRPPGNPYLKDFQRCGRGNHLAYPYKQYQKAHPRRRREIHS